MASKKRYEELKRMGLCPCCGKNPHAEGKILCQPCLDEAAKDREYKRKHRVCIRCGKNKAAPNRRYCDDCLEWRHNRYEEQKNDPNRIEAFKLYRKRHNQKYRELGLCTSCGKPVFEGHSLCYEHLLANRRNIRKNRNKNIEFKEN